jgi:hypothetical protein
MARAVEASRFFWTGYRPGEERGRTTFRFQAEPAAEVWRTRVSAVVPPEQPFELNYADAEGKVVMFEIEPRQTKLSPQPKYAATYVQRQIVNQRFIINRGMSSSFRW